MLDLSWLCGLAIQTVYWLVMLACNLLGYSPVWAKNALKIRQQEENRRLPLKLPSHLAVSFSDRKVCKDELLALFECCSAVGIRRLSLYDPWNDCSSLSTDLKMRCAQKGIDILDFHRLAPIRQPSARLSVMLLPSDSGKQSLVETCLKLSSTSEAVSVQSISQEVSDRFVFGEPELLIQVGQTPTLAGFQPWLLRITEFVQCSRLPCSRYAFEDCLASFSKRDIRVGK